MESEEKLRIKMNDREYELDILYDFNLINKTIISLLEEEYNKKINKTNNLYKIFYFDEDQDKNYIKSQEDYNFFLNITNELHLEVDEKKIKIFGLILGV